LIWVNGRRRAVSYIFEGRDFAPWNPISIAAFQNMRRTPCFSSNTMEVEMRIKDLVSSGSKTPTEKTGGVHPLDIFQRDFAGFRKEMDRLFDSFFNGGIAARVWPEGKMPSVDESIDDKAYHVKVDLPGMEEKNIDIALSDGMLTIRGERSVEEEEKDKDFVRKERSWGKFERTVSLPFEVDEDKVTASFDKGVLSVTLPKSAKAQAKVKKISVAKT
jgi:HSP20 family protein